MTKGPVIRCRRCGPFPVLGGVPVLVPEPSEWCAAFHDAALAALAETGRLGPTDVATLEAFASNADADAQSFSDDWTAAERHAGVAAEPVEGPASDVLETLASIAERESPSSWLVERVPKGIVLEVGCGAGITARRLPSQRLLVGDLSLRAVLVATRNSKAVPVVIDAHQLPVKARSVDAVLAENVVDLLDSPEDFFTRARSSLSKRGRLLLATPGPALGSPDGDETQLTRLATRSGFTVVDERRGLPWLRRNSSRFIEVWLSDAIELSPR